MKIESKYNIGDHIWVVYKERIEVHIFEDYISGISIEEDGKIFYYLKNTYEDIKEDEMILYDETDKLIAKIQELMKSINEREEENGESN